MNLLRTKSVEQSIRDTEAPEHRLRRALSALDLTVFGVGVIIGTGIFVLTGQVARDKAGPAVALSFILAAVVCGLAALCYAEFASTVPVAGSAYTFSYATLGEFPAWIIGWDLILEMGLAAAVVAVGWSGYFAALLDDIGITVPGSIADPPGEGGTVNVPAIALVLAVTALLVIGIKISSRVNAIVVTIKVAVVLLVIVAGLFYVKAANYDPFIPPSKATEEVGGLNAPLMQVLFGFTPATYGWLGIFSALAIVFFAYIGFDIVATAAEEAKRPQRDLPIGLIGSLVITAILYAAVSIVVVGMQNYTRLSTDAPLADAFKANGHPAYATIIDVGAVAGLITVVMILLLGMSRILFAMARDGLLPGRLAVVHPRFGTPYRATVLMGGIAAVLAGFIPLAELAELVNIGTLFAFLVVSVAVVVMRRTRPDLPRAFRTPWVPVVPALSVLGCLFVMINLPVETWLRFLAWMVVGIAVYALYGVRNSNLQRSTGTRAKN
ncbi:amino acid/polyamine/organocation transporter (APC superfamily) [Actinomadura pelletieri DSM 43383]|uniref:Amino acid/polyamine/organocation transporter (APC superfamily) n=1 Tax=Actinomadura pelletieri DSM 43383 TaxID=1120940 RepID=A0A495QB22_9ACTN|nr:amino acid permease [Actinomadura pelletieri]RKS68883.1 amino acid/polyamine/organocation transporter (APC superfamily) [Actinomadura pelletieri DSM 43383]